MMLKWLLPLICFTSLTLVTGMDLGPMIRIAQCRSTCLQRLGTKGECGEKNDNCRQCWRSCNMLERLDDDIRQITCEQRNFQSFDPSLAESRQNILRSPLPLVNHRCAGCEAACMFYQTKELETYDPSKLPAPERGAIDMEPFEVAVVMRKNHVGIWTEDKYYTAKEPPKLVALEWILIVDEKGGIRQHSWEKWWPKLDTFVTGSNSLDQAYITWYDWRDQLKHQRSVKLSHVEPVKFEALMRKDEMTKPQYVVTWQQENGYGITGNQVTNCESAQLSLSPGNKYLVRIASSEGPGSYPIVISTQHWTDMEIVVFDWRITLSDCIFLLSLAITCLVMFLILFEIRLMRKGIRNQMNKVVWNKIENALVDGYRVDVERLSIKPMTKPKKSFAESIKEYLKTSTKVDRIVDCKPKMKSLTNQLTHVTSDASEKKDTNANIKK